MNTEQEIKMQIPAAVRGAPTERLVEAANILSRGMSQIEAHGFNIRHYTGAESGNGCYIGHVHVASGQDSHYEEASENYAVRLALSALDGTALAQVPRVGDLAYERRAFYFGAIAETLGFLEENKDNPDANARRASEIFKLALTSIYNELDERNVRLVLDDLREPEGVLA